MHRVKRTKRLLSANEVLLKIERETLASTSRSIDSKINQIHHLLNHSMDSRFIPIIQDAAIRNLFLLEVDVDSLKRQTQKTRYEYERRSHISKLLRERLRLLIAELERKRFERFTQELASSHSV